MVYTASFAMFESLWEVCQPREGRVVDFETDIYDHRPESPTALSILAPITLQLWVYAIHSKHPSATRITSNWGQSDRHSRPLCYIQMVMWPHVKRGRLTKSTQMEAMVKGQKETPDKFPRIITCPNEVSVRDGFADPKCWEDVDGGHVNGGRLCPLDWQTSVCFGPCWCRYTGLVSTPMAIDLRVSMVQQLHNMLRQQANLK